MKLARSGLILLAIVLLGLLLRIYGLGSESLWLDEGISFKLAHARPILAIVERALNNHPPLYFLILHYWIKLFGASVFYARLLSAIFGSLAVFLIYKIGCLTFNKETGILGALLLAISSFHIYYSQEMRMYSMAVFLALLSMYFFMRLVWGHSAEDRSLRNAMPDNEASFKRPDPAKALSTGYIISSVCLLYTHYSGLLILISQNIYFITLFLFNKKQNALNPKKWAKYQAISLILYLPWLWIGILRFTKIQASHFWLLKPSAFSIVKSFVEYSGSVGLFPIFIILVFSFMLASVRKYRNVLNLPDAYKIHLLSAWMFLPIIVLFAISLFSKPLYVTKYVIVSSLPFYILVALSIVIIKRKPIKPLIIGVILVFSLIDIGKYHTEPNKLPWKDVVNHIEENAKSGDLLIFNDILCQRNVFNYYFKRTDVKKEVLPQEFRKESFVIIDKKNIKELEKISKGHNRIWVILSHTIDHDMLIENRFGKSYNIPYHKKHFSNSYLTHKTDNVIEVFLLEKR